MGAVSGGKQWINRQSRQLIGWQTGDKLRQNTLEVSGLHILFQIFLFLRLLPIIFNQMPTFDSDTMGIPSIQEQSLSIQ